MTYNVSSGSLSLYTTTTHIVTEFEDRIASCYLVVVKSVHQTHL